MVGWSWGGPVRHRQAVSGRGAWDGAEEVGWLWDGPERPRTAGLGSGAWDGAEAAVGAAVGAEVGELSGECWGGLWESPSCIGKGVWGVLGRAVGKLIM